MTNLLLALIEATTKAGPELMALIKSATVSVPVDVYFVMFVPSLMLNVPPGNSPNDESEALLVRGTVPIPIAGAPGVLAELELDDVVEDDEVVLFVDADVELPDGFNAACTAADSWDLTRLSACPLAMLARPLPRLVSAWPMTLMSEASADCAWL
jgi:hypothetical protein